MDDYGVVANCRINILGKNSFWIERLGINHEELSNVHQWCIWEKLLYDSVTHARQFCTAWTVLAMLWSWNLTILIKSSKDLSLVDIYFATGGPKEMET